MAGDALLAAHLPGEFAPAADLFKLRFPGNVTKRDYRAWPYALIRARPAGTHEARKGRFQTHPYGSSLGQRG